VFGNQQPDADEVAADLVGQHLADVPLQAARIPGLHPSPLLAAMDLNASRLGAWTIGVEFFFEGRDHQ
jgi:hypothetical protein